MELALILVLSFLLRLPNLNQSLWLDEAIQAVTVQGSFQGLFQELQGDFHPPLYHLMMWIWVRIFGVSEISLRLPSVLFGIGTVFVVYLIGQEMSSTSEVSPRQRRGPSTSEVFLPFIAAIFMATAPFHIYYSQEARMYAMATFFASLSMYFFLRLARNSELQFAPDQRANLKILYVLSTTLLLYTDYFGLFILLAQGLTLLVILKKRILALLPCYFVTLLLFLPWFPMFLTQIKQGYQSIQVLPEWGNLVNVNFFKALPLTFIKFSIGRITFFNKKIYAAISAILFAIYGLIINKGFFFPREDPREVKPLRRFNLIRNLIRKNQILSWLLVPVLCAWLISLFIPNYQPFRLLVCLPAFYLLLVYGISNFSVKMVQIILTTLIVGVNLVATSVYLFNPYFHREDWRGAVRFIERQSSLDALAVLPSMSSSAPYRYYSKGQVSVFGNEGRQIVKEKDKENFLKAFRDKKEIWYIDYLRPLFDPDSFIEKWLKDAAYVKIKEISFNQIPVLHYQNIDY